MSSVSSWDSMRSLFPTPMLYGFTIEFMVAKERPGKKGSSSSDDGELRYACPANENHPEVAILTKCKEVLLQQNQAVSVKQSIASNMETLNLDGQDQGSVLKTPDHWTLESAPKVVAQDGRPLQYKWVGIRLHSPMFPEADFDKKDSIHHRCLAALRNSIIIYVGSTCHDICRIRPANYPIELNTAKKLATLMHKVEYTIMGMGPNVRHWNSPHCNFFRLHLGQRVRYLKDNHGSMLESAAMARLREEHTDRGAEYPQNALQAIWREESIADLAQALEPQEGWHSAFRICLDGNENIPTAVFRYALWHPHEGVDVSAHWVRLAMCLYRNAELEQSEFRDLCERIHATISRNSRDDESAEWTGVMEELRFPDDAVRAWLAIGCEYSGSGGSLSTRLLDWYPPLSRVDEPWRA